MLEILAGIAGFAIGRFGDKYFGYLEWIGFLPVPHHWITGLFFILISFLFWKKYKSFALCLIAFGIGLFISDGNDFLHWRFFGPEPSHIWKFWSIN